MEFKIDQLELKPTGAVHWLTRSIPDLSSWLQAGELSGCLSHPVIPPQELYSQDQVRFSLQSGPWVPQWAPECLKKKKQFPVNVAVWASSRPAEGPLSKTQKSL